MNKHTPGPWSAAKDNNGRPYVLSNGVIRIADCWYLPIGKEHSGEAEANAKLIAAAPEMLTILDELEDSFDKEIYPEQAKEGYDAPDDRPYFVTITAKQWRALGRALGKATGAT